MNCEITMDAVRGAIHADNAACLSYFHKRGTTYDYKNDCVQQAASGGHVRCLEYLFMFTSNLLFQPPAWIEAARTGQIACLEWMLKMDHRPNSHDSATALRVAAENAQIPCIEYLWEMLPTMTNATALLQGALNAGHADVLQLAAVKEANLTNAFRMFGGHFLCIQYLYRVGVTPDNFYFCRLARKISLECLQYMLEHGCTVSAGLSEALAEGGNLKGLKLVHRMGCQWDKYTCAEAAKGGHLACLQYAHENGCPWKDSDDGSEGSKYDPCTCSSAALASTLIVCSMWWNKVRI